MCERLHHHLWCLRRNGCAAVGLAMVLLAIDVWETNQRRAAHSSGGCLDRNRTRHSRNTSPNCTHIHTHPCSRDVGRGRARVADLDAVRSCVCNRVDPGPGAHPAIGHARKGPLECTRRFLVRAEPSRRCRSMGPVQRQQFAHPHVAVHSHAKHRLTHMCGFLLIKAKGGKDQKTQQGFKLLSSAIDRCVGGFVLTQRFLYISFHKIQNPGRKHSSSWTAFSDFPVCFFNHAIHLFFVGCCTSHHHFCSWIAFSGQLVDVFITANEKP